MQKYSTIAIGSANQASLWCEIVEAEPGEDPAGVHFEVINGAWRGQIKGGQYWAKRYPKEKFNGEIVWVGDLPGLNDRYDYGAAFQILEKVLKKPQKRPQISTGLALGALAVGLLTTVATKKTRKYEEQELRKGGDRWTTSHRRQRLSLPH